MRAIKLRLSYLLLFFISTSVLSAQPSVDAGKTLFRNYCAQCHAKDMKSPLTGPALGTAEENWSEYSREDLYAWIRNSQGAISSGHPRALELWDEYKPTVMNANPQLTDEDIESIILYINDVNTAVPTASVGGGQASNAPTSEKFNWLFYVLFGLLVILAVVLTRIITNLNTIVAAKEGRDIIHKSLLERILSKQVISFAIFALVVFGGFTTVKNAINLGRQQGYKPDQPINFSHAVHAGENKIDCQYCHDGARRSKHSIIPAANTCMNCHKAITNGSSFGTQELTKIYASMGYDPNSNRYIENYEMLEEDEIKAIYTKWIGDQYMNTKSLNELDRKGEKLVENQWNGIVEALTNEQKKTIPGPIEWTRVHNLPDHVYFNHSQHVTVGKLECQTCHGKVEEMEIVEQYAPLSMGWCVNCHRKTEVQFEDNPYYDSYENYHDQLIRGEKEKITVGDIGGLECQKCHY